MSTLRVRTMSDKIKCDVGAWRSKPSWDVNPRDVAEWIRRTTQADGCTIDETLDGSMIVSWHHRGLESITIRR